MRNYLFLLVVIFCTCVSAQKVSYVTLWGDTYVMNMIKGWELSTGEKLYNHIRGRYKKYNGYLAELAEELQITDMKLTTYVSRHTMAMMLQRNNVSREQISQILGHADMKTTNTYLDSFDTTVIDEAAKVLYDV